MEAENKYLWLGNHTENKYLWLGNHTSFAKLYLYIYIIINNYVYNKGGGIWSRITIIELCFVLHCEMEQPCDDPRYAWIITRLFHFTMEDLAKFYDCSNLLDVFHCIHCLCSFLFLQISMFIYAVVYKL